MTLLKHLENYMGIIIVVFAALGYLFPHLFTPLAAYDGLLLMLALFLGCLKIDFGDILHLKQNAWKCMAYTLIYLIAMPILFYILTPFLDSEFRLALFLLVCASSAFSNALFASFLKLKILWAAAFSTLTSIIVPFTLPLLVSTFFDITLDISPLEMMLFLTKLSFIPIGAAIVVKQCAPRLTRSVLTISGPLGVLILGFFAAIIITKNNAFLTEHLFTLSTIPVLVGLSGVFLYGFVAGLCLPASTKDERWTNSLLFGNMNNGLIILLASSFFTPKVLFVTLLSEIPWTLAQPVFQWAKKRWY